MDNPFFEKPILNSPYEYPARHWELDDAGLPTGKTIPKRRGADFITPVPKPKKQKGRGEQTSLDPGDPEHLSSAEQKYQSAIINGVRNDVERWRKLPPEHWRVTPETAQLLEHWRAHEFSHIRPFFCQIEAAETAIWLTEVAPGLGREGKKYLEYLDNANRDANSELPRLALKMATGSGKTTVMAMLIAWQTINAIRHPQSKRFTRGFLIVTPGITIRDRLRVLRPNDPDSYYKSRELIPPDMLPDLERARIVITNYHAFKRRELLEISRGGRDLIQGQQGEPLKTLETEGQMLKRVMGDLMGMKNILAINDEAHHCYREKSGQIQEGPLKGEDKKEAEKNREAARLWISGLETAARKIGIRRVVDLSATPFFLRGSGYAEGTLFPWTLSDFSLMDAIECGIVKLPRVPIVDNVPGADIPKFRNLWEHIGKRMPKKGRGKAGAQDPLSLPAELKSALEALYGHYVDKTFARWEEAHIPVPPCFIIVCNNTATSKLVYDYISGFRREDDSFENGRLPLFRNFDEEGNRYPHPRTLLIDSEQLESGEGLDKDFRDMAKTEIEQFRQEIFQRGGRQADELRAGKAMDDVTLLREVMNTVGKPGRLGGGIRCVVSVSMLTEGWDANTVTHVLGVRAFGTQLLCEQVIGRALRRQSYDLNEEGLFEVEYADVFGIPFDFTAKPEYAPVPTPREVVRVRAVRPERDALAIRFPRVTGYRIKPPIDHIRAVFTADSSLELTPDLVGPTITQNAGIIGEGVELGAKDTENTRRATLAFHLTKRFLETRWRDPDQCPKWHLFGQIKQISENWLDACLTCRGNTHPGQLLYQELADMACARIEATISGAEGEDERLVQVVLDRYNPSGSTHHVDFKTTKTSRYRTDPRRCHIDWVITDSDWEAEFCRVAERHPRVLAYVKNHNLGFEVPYRQGSQNRIYRPDFIVLVDDGHGDTDPLHLVVEIKGYRGEDAKDKKLAMENHWVPGVNRQGEYGRWGFVEFTDVYAMQDNFDAVVGS
uniref:Type III restriction enzyme n=1 Tax=Candidatus Kentrum sp. DK TaxID=2126562 RepID=A0A450SJF9_9GAMM|nr:MAG: type III restriction enzyme [Candidatus Kentron sp. DK]